MRNTFGTGISLTIFGESHGEAVGAVLDGIAPGIAVRDESIREALRLRRPSGEHSTARVERDAYKIISGVKDGVTTGAPLTLLIPNESIRSEDYAGEFIPRPSHADYPAHIRYGGYEDRLGGGHFSGRLTAPIVAVCAILRDALKQRCGITIGTHILSLGAIREEALTGSPEELEALASLSFPVLSPEKGEEMKGAICRAKESSDSVGGVLESVILGAPVGLGEPWFDKTESVLSHLLFAIGGVKGVEFGDGFAICEMLGSEANDPYALRDGRVVCEKNSSGGVSGGLTNGMPIRIRTAVKPTPSIAKAQRSVNLERGEECTLEIVGRHDGAIVHRVAHVVNALLAFGMCELLVLRYGADVLREGI